MLGRLSRVQAEPLRVSVEALRAEQKRSDRALGVHAICVFGRKLVEEMVAELLRRRAIKPAHELMKNIEALREARAISPWVASCMHGLRILGNEAVHVRDRDVAFTPKTLGRADLAQALAAMRALLESWDAGM